jgi:hypothetical protein
MKNDKSNVSAQQALAQVPAERASAYGDWKHETNCREMLETLRSKWNK